MLLAGQRTVVRAFGHSSTAADDAGNTTTLTATTITIPLVLLLRLYSYYYYYY